MLPSVWPGVLMTFHGMLPIFTTSPWLTRWSTGHAGNFWSSRGTGLSPQIMSASMAEAMTVAPVRLRSSAAAATWSEWRCVSTMASSLRPPKAAAIFFASLAGSTTKVAEPSDTT